MLDIKVEEIGDVTVGHLSGNLDATTAFKLKSEIEIILEQRKIDVVFNLSDLDLIDSSGVGAIVSLFKRVRQLQGDVKLAAITGQPAEIFKLLRLDKAFQMFDTVEEAVAKFKA